MSESLAARAKPEHHFTNKIVQIFLDSNLSIILIIIAVAVGLVALWVTPREEDPQIVVPLADVFVQFPGRSAAEVEQLVATPLEKILYQIDGVEYVYSMSSRDQAVITVRFFVGEDRERSLVKLFKKLDESLDLAPPGVAGWLVKPVEIDDVPIVTLTLTSSQSDDMTLRRTAEELTERLAAVANVSRAYVVGGRARSVRILLDPERMAAYAVSPGDVRRAIAATNLRRQAGELRSNDEVIEIEIGQPFDDARQLNELVVGVFDQRPVFLKDVAAIEDGPEETGNYVRHGWGPARRFVHHAAFPGTVLEQGRGDHDSPPSTAATEAATHTEAQAGAETPSQSAVTIAIAKKKGANAVWVAEAVLAEAERLRASIVPDDMDLIVTRNYGLTADEKVNELVEALVVAVIIVVALLTMSLGWREALIVAVAVPVVFGLTLAVNLLFGFTINRVTLFALILSLGLLVDDPIVDVENIARHFALRGRATRRIVLEAVAEIRPPLITATLAVIVSFLPMFFITGMMGPYMRPMALNVPVTMIMSMVVAFTITPWLSYLMLRRKYAHGDAAAHHADDDDLDAVKQSALYKFFYPLMAPLLRSRWNAWAFLVLMGLLTVAAIGLAAVRAVPLKMLPFDNKNELLLVLDLPEGTTLERTDAAVRDFEHYLSQVPEVVNYISYVGVSSPMDFNGLVRHYYLRRGDHLAELRINLAAKKNRRQQSHAIGLRMRPALDEIARRHGAALKLVETPPGPPVIASVVAEVYGQADDSYDDILAAADIVKERLAREPGIVDLDDMRVAPQTRAVFVPDAEKAAINGVSVEDISATIRAAFGDAAGTIHDPRERNPLRIELRIPIDRRATPLELTRLHVKGREGAMVPLAELGRWSEERRDQTIYHKNLKRVAYVLAETAGRPPADVIVDVLADRAAAGENGAPSPPAGALRVGPGWVAAGEPRPVAGRTFFRNGSGIAWFAPPGFRIDFAGEGEWQITLDVFRDLGLAFAAAMVGIYVLLVAQTGSFAVPIVVMLAIPLTVLGVLPGFWLLNWAGAETVGGYLDPVYFTATGMIGMIALAGIVTRDSIILVDFIHLSLARGRSLFDAIMESRVVRLRPILLTAGAAMLGAVPIIIDPIFSGLAWSLIFGLFASTVFTLFVIPVAYWLIYDRVPGHGLHQSAMDEETP